MIKESFIQNDVGDDDCFPVLASKINKLTIYCKTAMALKIK